MKILKSSATITSCLFLFFGIFILISCSPAVTVNNPTVIFTVTVNSPAEGIVTTNLNTAIRIEYQVYMSNTTGYLQGVYLSDNGGSYTNFSTYLFYGQDHTFSAGPHTLSFYAKSEGGDVTAIVTRQIVATNSL